MNRVEALDGLRGLAALWVLVGHAMILTGFAVPLISQPELGVDLFILLSGFLMVFQYQLRSHKEDWTAPATWAQFWVRRYFRIAPLFYVMLAAALIFGPAIYADRVLIDTFLGQTLQKPERYLDGGAFNIFTHITFLFGLLPDYAYRTALPDWSLGLEMQFYALFPLFILLVRRLGWPVASILIAAGAFATAVLTAKIGMKFPMPAFLPLKMHLFLSGMLVAAALTIPGQRSRQALYLVLAIGFGFIPLGGKADALHFAIRALLILAFYALVHLRRAGPIDAAARLLGSRPGHWLGELSFGVYLVHLLVMQPVTAMVIRMTGPDFGAGARFALVFVIVAPVSYAIAWVAYHLVELPGQQLGKRLLRPKGPPPVLAGREIPEGPA